MFNLMGHKVSFDGHNILTCKPTHTTYSYTTRYKGCIRGNIIYISEFTIGISAGAKPFV